MKLNKEKLKYRVNRFFKRYWVFLVMFCVFEIVYLIFSK